MIKKNSNTIRVVEVFSSIAGEGRYAGTPMLFIRLFGCTRDCSWCDTGYSKTGRFKEMTIEELIERIKKSKLDYVVWTGGEPLLQLELILEVVRKTRRVHPRWKFHHLETNGDLIDKLRNDFKLFHYIAISPKEPDVAMKVYKDWNLGNQSDIKVVTDLKKVGVNMIKWATMLMPLSVYKPKKDLEIQRKVWKYCVRHNLKYSPRLQVNLFGKKRGV